MITRAKRLAVLGCLMVSPRVSSGLLGDQGEGASAGGTAAQTVLGTMSSSVADARVSLGAAPTAFNVGHTHGGWRGDVVSIHRENPRLPG
jgi:hypothetical protein